jgi:hypothetical protein
MMHCVRREMWMCIVREGRFAHENITGFEEKSQRQQLRQMTEKVGRLKGLEFGPPFT